MAFGTAITELDVVANGDFGYIVKIDTASLLAQIIESVQVQASAYSTPEPTKSSVSMDTLYSYLNNQGCPLIAFHYSDGECWLFVKDNGSNTVARAGTTAYAVDDIVKNAAADKRYICVEAGISAALEPAGMSGNTSGITDGTVTWDYLDDIPLANSYPYTSTTRFALFGKRKPQNCTDDSDELDLPDRDLSLLNAYCLSISYGLKKTGVPKWINTNIKEGEYGLRNE